MRLFVFFVLAPLLVSLVSCVFEKESDAINLGVKADVKINYFVDNSKNPEFDIEVKEQFLDSAYFYTSKILNDTLRNKSVLKVSYLYYNLKSFSKFQRLNKEGIELSKKIKDTSRLALAYWDLGNYYFDNRFVSDSAYYYFYKSEQLYNKVGNDFFSARLLYTISRVQQRVKDYVRSEVSLSRAISIFKSLDKDKWLYNCYNSLGIANNGLEEFDKAIEYYDKALEYVSSTPQDVLKTVRIYNNKGVVYKHQKDFKKALETYSMAFKYDSIFYKDPKLYAFLLDNNAYSRLKLGDSLGVKKALFRALNIRDSISAISDIATSKLHLAEFFAFQNDSISAVEYALSANKLAKESGNNENLLDAYLLLADLDKENGVNYTKMHIALNDSLQKEERKIRNKFARIKFETEEIQDRNVQLSKQRYWITALLGATVLVALLGYIVFSQRSRNKVLEFERMQQHANEEIYNLMLSQQTKLEEGSQREKKRISEELHDGVLGRMFGTRLSLGSLNDKDDAESKKTRQLYLEELKSIEEEVRGISHELSTAMFNSERSYISMVSELLARQSVVTDFDYTVDSDYSIDWDHVSGNMKINLYRIIQESIQNINKYAKASKVIINFEKIENSFVLSIKDDGIGFDIGTAKKGIGLKNIRSRVSKLGGNASITSEKNVGTSIQIQVPFKIIVKNEETV